LLEVNQLKGQQTPEPPGKSFVLKAILTARLAFQISPKLISFHLLSLLRNAVINILPNWQLSAIKISILT